MAITSTKANIEDRDYRKRLGRQEQRIVNVAEDYTPTTSTDWTSGVGSSSAPTTQDGALDDLAANASGASQQTVKATYDFSTDGGTQGDIDLSVNIPDDSIIIEVYEAILSAPTSGGSNGTIKLILPIDGDLTANITADGAATSVYTDANEAPLSTEKRTTAARSLSVTIATSDITAGKIEYFVRFLKSS